MACWRDRYGSPGSIQVSHEGHEDIPVGHVFGAAVFGMGVCATTSMNVLIALGFCGGLGLSGSWLIERAGNIRTARVGEVLAALALR